MSRTCLTTISLQLAAALLASVAGFGVAGDLLDQIDTDPWWTAIDSVVAKMVVILEEHDIEAAAVTEVRAADGWPPPTIAPGLRRRLRDGLRAAGKLDDDAAAKIALTLIPVTEQADESALPDATPAESEPREPPSFVGLSVVVSLTPPAAKRIGDLDGKYLVPQSDQQDADETTVLGRDGLRKQPFVVEQGRFTESVWGAEFVLAAWGGSGVAEGESDGGYFFRVDKKDLTAKPLIVSQGRWVSLEDALVSLALGDAEGKPLPVEMIAGTPTVTLRSDAAFTVLVGNGDRPPIGARILIDGLDSRYFAEAMDPGPRSLVVIGTPHPFSPRIGLADGWSVPRGGQRSFGGLDDDARADHGSVTLLVTDTKPETFYRKHVSQMPQTRRVPREEGGTAEIEALVGMAHPIGIEESWTVAAIAEAAADGAARRVANRQVWAVLTIAYRRAAATDAGPP